MDAREEMHEQIAGNARAVVAIIAPAEQPHRLERPLWRVADEAIPIDRLGRRIERQRVLPRAQRGVAIDPGLHQRQAADGPGAVQLARLRIHDRADALAADLDNAVRLARDLGEREPFLDLLHHRLLDVDVLARFHRIDRDALVPR